LSRGRREQALSVSVAPADQHTGQQADEPEGAERDERDYNVLSPSAFFEARAPDCRRHARVCISPAIAVA